MPAAHLFMKLAGPGNSTILGESEVDGYEGQIILDDWSWGLAFKKEEGKADQLEPAVFSFSKALDRSTTALLTCLRSGGVLPSAEITLEETSEADFELVVRLKDIRVQGYDVDGEVDDTDGHIKEKWVFNYRTIELDYTPSKEMPRDQRGVLKSLLTRPPGASSTPVSGGGDKEKLLEVLKKVPEAERHPLWASVEKALSTLKSDEPDPKAKGKGKG